MNKSSLTDLDEHIEIMLSHFEAVINLNEDEKEYLISFLKFKRVRKRQHILQAGDVCHYETFIIKGLLKSYFVDENDTEHILLLSIQ
jgi:hypothetical protein